MTANGLTELESNFCWHYAKTLDRAIAYKKAGYSVKNPQQAAAAAQKLLNKPKVRDYLNEILALSPSTVLNELIAIAMGQITDVVKVTGEGILSILPTDEWGGRSRSAVKTIKMRRQVRRDENGDETETTSIEIAMHDKLNAIDKLLKILQIMPSSGDVLGAVQVLAANDLILPAQAEVVSDGIEDIKEGLRQLSIWDSEPG